MLNYDSQNNLVRCNVTAQMQILADTTRQGGCHFLDHRQSGSRYKERIYSVVIVSEFSESAVIISPRKSNMKVRASQFSCVCSVISYWFVETCEVSINTW